MKIDDKKKKAFMNSYFGSQMKECVSAWDAWLTELSKYNVEQMVDQAYEYHQVRKAAGWCQAQWEVYKMAIEHFYHVEYNFSRTDEYYGICTEDRSDWLFKVERKL